MRVTAVVLMGLISVAGCTGSSSPAPSPSATSPSVSPSPTLTAAEQMQQLAEAGYKSAYKATYAVRQRKPSGHATWVVWRQTNALRVDVVTGHVTTTLINAPTATFACRKTPHHRTCFRVAKGGKGPFRLLAEKLFSSDLATLRNLARGYTVTAAASQKSGASCFAVKPDTKSAKAVARATYCFTDNGVLAAVTYPSGNIVRLQHLNSAAPRHQTFRPYSSPTPVAG